jgi:DNA-3-methyladenine glycosylase II
MDFNIRPHSTFDFDLSAGIFSDGDEYICKYKDGRFWQVIRLNKNKMVLASLRSLGSVDDPMLSVNLMPDDNLSGNDAAVAESKLRLLFNLDLDLLPFYDAVRGDPVMSKIAGELRGLCSPSTASVFEALVDSIIEQQISLKAAWSLERRLIKAFGDSISVGVENYYAYPEPQRLARATLDALRGCGLSARKAEYIVGLSKLIENGLNLEKFKDYQDQNRVIEELCQIRGIGVWTAELAMVRGMQKLDAIPADDLGLRRCISHYYCSDRKITGTEARKIAEAWIGYRGLASYYLMTAERLGIKP